MYGADRPLENDTAHGLHERCAGNALDHLQAIQAATVNAAEPLGRTSDVGAIAVGRNGDLVGVAGDPLADVTARARVPKSFGARMRNFSTG